MVSASLEPRRKASRAVSHLVLIFSQGVWGIHTSSSIFLNSVWILYDSFEQHFSHWHADSWLICTISYHSYRETHLGLITRVLPELCLVKCCVPSFLNVHAVITTECSRESPCNIFISWITVRQFVLISHSIAQRRLHLSFLPRGEENVKNTRRSCNIFVRLIQLHQRQ